jgi:hypothetical protein
MYFQNAEQAYLINLPTEQFKHSQHILMVVNPSSFDAIVSSIKDLLI